MKKSTKRSKRTVDEVEWGEVATDDEDTGNEQETEADILQDSPVDKLSLLLIVQRLALAVSELLDPLGPLTTSLATRLVEHASRNQEHKVGNGHSEHGELEPFA